MDVKTVCLGLLTFGEASGYDLKKHFDAAFEHFFSTGYGSIYPALASLAEEGLADCTAVPQAGRPDRKVYRITAAGAVVVLAPRAAATHQGTDGYSARQHGAGPEAHESHGLSR